MLYLWTLLDLYWLYYILCLFFFYNITFWHIFFPTSFVLFIYFGILFIVHKYTFQFNSTFILFSCTPPPLFSYIFFNLYTGQMYVSRYFPIRYRCYGTLDETATKYHCEKHKWLKRYVDLKFEKWRRNTSIWTRRIHSCTYDP